MKHERGARERDGGGGEGKVSTRLTSARERYTGTKYRYNNAVQVRVPVRLSVPVHTSVRKRCARRVPNNLSEEQKRGRVDWCTHMLRKFDEGRSPHFRVILTGDETWVYQYENETKQKSEVWVFPD